MITYLWILTYIGDMEMVLKKCKTIILFVGGFCLLSEIFQGKSFSIPNPASQNCIKIGGNLQIVTGPQGGQYGICVFSNNYQCEEWALFRNECPAGG